ncbi:MAG: hypothetical protein OXR72_14120 [Gemmatimonadota bacterium]|nr:hypothetical protein [Gemmatimonadota bacterium]
MRGTEREITLPEIQNAKLQHQHCRQNDAQAAEPGADSTFMIVTLLMMIVTWVFVVVSGEGGK